MEAASTFVARAVAVSLAGTRLVEEVHLALGPGDLLAITGGSGCGKTTLLRALAGLIDLAAGEVLLGGQGPDEIGWPSWRRRVLFTAQRPVLHDETVRSNLRRPFEVRAAGGQTFPESRARELLSALSLPDDCMERQALTLSEGQQQRVCFARAQLVAPDVLLLDEPTSALDPVAAERIERLLRDDLQRRRSCAVLVTHDPEQAKRLGTQQLTLGSEGDG